MLKAAKPAIKNVRKRDGSIVIFEEARIVNAVNKAIKAVEGVEGKEDPKLANKISQKVVSKLKNKFGAKLLPGVEDIQDTVEEVLIKQGLNKVAKAYILYRSERAKLREAKKLVPKDVRKLAQESKKYFKNPLAEFIYYRTYSRWIDSLGRRETWIETVDRYMDFMRENIGKKLTEDEYKEIRGAILNQEAVPSMRLMWGAGKAARKTNVTAYNCSFIAPSRLEDFAEIMYLSMCGTGVGFSAESQNIQQLPIIKFQTGEKLPTHIIEDSKEGWGDALTLGLKAWFDGKDTEFDFSKIRPAGSRLNTMGGRSSGPEPLRALLEFSREKILSRQGKRLTNLNVHDIICKIGEVVVMGGVRRSALLSLSDLDDEEMRHAKEGQFYMFEPQRMMANNSAAYNRKPTTAEFTEEWLALAKSGTGERGIFNRAALQHQLPARRWEVFKKHWPTSGTNPCAEIILRNKQFCNLSEVVCRSEDTKETLLKKIRIATILGTYQSTLTNFPYLSKEWKRNCEEERLLGVSLTGQWDSETAREPEVLRALREYAVEVNKEYAKRFGINQSTCVTCVKPSGCRPWHSITTTDGGLLTLEELFGNHNEANQWDDFRGKERVVQGNPHKGKIRKTYVNGLERILRIKMNYGLGVESTPNHQWFVSHHYDHRLGKNNKRKMINRWVQASELRPGDVLETYPGIYKNKKHALLCDCNSLSIKMRGDAHSIKQPNQMNEDLAWLFGYLWGDGAMSPGKYRIRFIDEIKENLARAHKILQEQFGIRAVIKKASQHRNAYTLDVGSKMLWHWLIRNEVFKYYADRLDIIPKCVRASSRDDIISFIAGLVDSDGWVGKKSNQNGYTLTLTSADEFFAQHIQDITWTVGLGFGRSLNAGGKNFQKEKRMYLMALGRYVLPDSFAVLLRNSNKMKRAEKEKEFQQWLWQNKKSNTLIAGKIISVEYGGIVPTYDIETDKNWYYAGSVKSHNTVSQLVDSASGMHPRHAKYYIRRVRISSSDPLFHMLRDQKFPHVPEVGQSLDSAATYVLEFPVKAPEKAVFRNDLSSLNQLEHWKNVKQNYTEHNPSVTISVGEEEWIRTANWLYENWDMLGGLSFLPRSDNKYALTPYEEITEERYNEMIANMPDIDFSQILTYEKSDNTEGAKELACVSGVCEIEEVTTGGNTQQA